MIDMVQVAALIRDAKSEDEYKLGEYKSRIMSLAPDVIYDVGACVGGFTLFASELFPRAKIVAVEPEEENYRMLVENTKHLPNVAPVHAALSAEEQIYYHPNSPGIANWIFVSKTSPTYIDGLPACKIPTVTLDQLYALYGGNRYVVKLDCESAELMIVTHLPSRKMVAGASYLAGEFHLWGRTHEILQETMRGFLWWVYELSTTSNVHAEFRGGMAMIHAERRVSLDSKNEWEDVLKTQA